jgi:hypothetical protein
MVAPLNDFEKVFTDGHHLMAASIDDQNDAIELLQSFIGRKLRGFKHTQTEIGAIQLLPKRKNQVEVARRQAQALQIGCGGIRQLEFGDTKTLHNDYTKTGSTKVAEKGEIE